LLTPPHQAAFIIAHAEYFENQLSMDKNEKRDGLAAIPLFHAQTWHALRVLILFVFAVLVIVVSHEMIHRHDFQDGIPCVHPTVMIPIKGAKESHWFFTSILAQVLLNKL